MVAPAPAPIILPERAPAQAAPSRPAPAPPVATVKAPATTIIATPVRIGCFFLKSDTFLLNVLTAETVFSLTVLRVLVTPFFTLLAVVHTFLYAFLAADLAWFHFLPRYPKKEFEEPPPLDFLAEWLLFFVAVVFALCAELLLFDLEAF